MRAPQRSRGTEVIRFVPSLMLVNQTFLCGDWSTEARRWLKSGPTSFDVGPLFSQRLVPWMTREPDSRLSRVCAGVVDLSVFLDTCLRGVVDALLLTGFGEKGLLGAAVAGCTRWPVHGLLVIAVGRAFRHASLACSTHGTRS